MANNVVYNWGERERTRVCNPPAMAYSTTFLPYIYIYIIGASVSEAPSCGLDGRAIVYIRPAPDTAHARRYAQT